MEIIKTFIGTFIEISAFLIIWCKFSLRTEKILFRNIAISFMASFVMTIMSPVHSNWPTILSYVTVICLISFLYREKFIISLLEFFITLMSVIILQLVLIQIVQSLTATKYEGSSPFLISIQVGTFLFSLVIYYFAPNRKIFNITEENYKTAFYILINFIGYILILRIVWAYNKNLILNNIFIATGLLVMIFVLNLLLCYSIMKINEEKKLIEIHNKFNPIIENIVEEIRRNQHDFKNHLNTIDGIVQVAKEEELRESLTTYIKSLNNFTKEIEDIVYIDNLILRAIIYCKLCEAERKSINFCYSVSNNLSQWSIKEYELSDILTNLLNNAFEEVGNNSEKKVELNIFKDSNQNIIEVKNSVNPINLEKISCIFNRGFSTKKGEHRGYGLYNVKKIVESNGGTIEIHFEGSYICFKISFKSR